jgi:hypothetical protein
MDEHEAYVPEVPKANPLRRIIAGALLLALLAGAAFTGMWLWQHGILGPAGLGPMMSGGPFGPGGEGTMMIQIVPAKELPPRPPDVMGMLAERTDNSLLISTSNGGVMVFSNSGGGDGTVQTQPPMDGPQQEVVITHDTLIYRDDTPVAPMSTGNQPPSGTIQQVVAPGSLEELHTQSFVTVWGERRGERVIAEVVLYHP